MLLLFNNSYFLWQFFQWILDTILIFYHQWFAILLVFLTIES